MSKKRKIPAYRQLVSGDNPGVNTRSALVVVTERRCRPEGKDDYSPRPNGLYL